MIKLIKSTFYHEAETKRALQEFIGRAEILSMNAECKRYEETFAVKQGRRFGVFVSSGSMANLILMQALVNLNRLKVKDTVGASSLTWATNIMPIIQHGLTPLLLDCELKTLNVSPALLEPHLKRLNALFITNVLGFSDRLDQIRELCDQHNVLLIEDNCEALGSKTAGTLLGNFGLASTFSFFVGHHLSTIEGGMICTDDEELYEMLVIVRAHGWDRNLPPEARARLRARHQIDDFFALYTFYELAYNGRPTEINGFIGNQQLPYLDEIVAKRASNFQQFQTAAAANPDIFHYDLSHMNVVSNFAMPVVFRDVATSERYKKKFTEAGVEIRPIIAGDISVQPFFKRFAADQPAHPHSQIVHRQGFYFGNNPEMTQKEVDKIISLLK